MVCKYIANTLHNLNLGGTSVASARIIDKRNAFFAVPLLGGFPLRASHLTNFQQDGRLFLFVEPI